MATPKPLSELLKTKVASAASTAAVKKIGNNIIKPLSELMSAASTAAPKTETKTSPFINTGGSLDFYGNYDATSSERNTALLQSAIDKQMKLANQGKADPNSEYLRDLYDTLERSKKQEKEQAESSVLQKALDTFRKDSTAARDIGITSLKNTPSSLLGGLGGYNASLATGLDVFIPDNPVTDPVLDYYKKTGSQLSQDAKEKAAENGTFGSFADTLTQGAVQAAPSAIMASMSAPLNASAALGKSAGTVAAALSKLAKNPIYWNSLLQETGSSYNSAIANGASEAEATATSLLYGFLAAGVEVSGGTEALPKNLVSNPSKSAISQWVKSAFEEGREEVVQGIIEQLANKAVYDTEKPYASLTNQNAVLNPQRMGQEFGMGATLGGLLGGGQVAAQNILGGLSVGKTSGTPTASPLLTQAVENNASANSAAPVVQPVQTQSPVTAQISPPQAQQDNGGVVFPKTTKTAQMGNKTAKETIYARMDEPNYTLTERLDNERGFSKNIATDKNMAPELQESFQTTPETYDTLSNKATLATAERAFKSSSATHNYANLKAVIASGGALVASDIPLARMVANQLVREGSFDEARDLLADVAVKLTEYGQITQAANILRYSDPATVLATVTRQLQKINEAGRRRYGKKWKDFTLTDSEMQQIANTPAGDTIAIQGIIEMVGERVGAEIPFTGWEKLTEFRRIAMLLNPKTQIRNVAGNVPLWAMRKTSEGLSAAIQDAAVRSGVMKKENQTRTAHVTKESRSMAKDLYEQQKGVLLNSSKWDAASLSSIVKNNAKVFKNTPMETVREFTYWLLEHGDTPFLKSAFVDNMSGIISAQGYDSVQDVPQSAIDTASKEALVATFRDASSFAQWVNGMKRNGGAAGAAVDILLPFVTTPVNIARRTIDYSPVAVLKLLSAQNRTSGAQIIDTVTKSLTGSAVIALGFGLRSLGLITGAADDDTDKAQFDKATGNSPYAILGKYSYDWVQPVGTALAVGAAIYEAASKDNNLLDKIMQVVYSGGDTLASMTFFRNIVDVFKGYGSISENIANAITSGLFSQVTPSLFGQIARTADGTVRSGYTGGGTIADAIAGVKAKIPGLSATLPESVNVKGEANMRVQNPLLRGLTETLSPGTLNLGSQNATDREIQRVYSSTGNNAVFPRSAYTEKTFSKNGKSYTMTGEELSRFQKTLGTETYNNLKKLFATAEYKATGDSNKADLIQDEISAANDIAKRELVESRGDMYLDRDEAEKVLSYTVAADISEQKAYAVYNGLAELTPIDGSSSVSTAQKIGYFLGVGGLSQKQKTALVGTLYTDSLLTEISGSDKLIQAYKETGDTGYINMKIPVAITWDKLNHKLTADERDLYAGTFVDEYEKAFEIAEKYYKNDGRYNDVLSDAVENAKSAAKQAVIDSRD